MDNYIFEHILKELYNEHITNYNENTLMNRVEEYLEWLKISKNRFCIIDPDYKIYLEPLIAILEEYQARLLLRQELGSRVYLQEKITYFTRTFHSK